MEFEEELKEILKSLYQTGVNDGKNNIVYFPTPEEFKLKQIITLAKKECLGCLPKEIKIRRKDNESDFIKDQVLGFKLAIFQAEKNIEEKYG